MTPPRPTPLLGFETPYVKAGDVVLPVLAGVGKDAELCATPAMWRRIFDVLEPLVREARGDAGSAVPASVGRAPILKPSRRIL
ncbi:hypothetical protein K0B96_06565 [Horticoccus luteus]|uniref:Uncharacterized protein n=1 Tax=Horticoccus luteus TaxID=2862869 RepID=A0A8F9XHI2_9BACT|nr:hypothetical protein [Horticoccus luteus]QYM80272.1 hypothetical protein K0B96_06565 [Horticoccus luteus]